jgi:hypothetical protein
MAAEATAATAAAIEIQKREDLDLEFIPGGVACSFIAA